MASRTAGRRGSPTGRLHLVLHASTGNRAAAGYDQGVTWLWMIYLAGVGVGLWRVDGPPPVKVLLAALWPVGPAMFVIVVAGLALAATVAFPWFGALVLAGLLALLILL